MMLISYASLLQGYIGFLATKNNILCEPHLPKRIVVKPKPYSPHRTEEHNPQ